MRTAVSIFAGIFILVALCCLQIWAQTDEDQIWKNEKAYLDFLKMKDSEGMVSLWNEDGIGWPASTPLPSGDKESRKAYLDGLFSQTDILAYEFNHKVIKVFGDAAIVHYILYWTVKDPEGKEEKLKTRITHTWMKQDGKWKIIGGMSSELNKSVTIEADAEAIKSFLKSFSAASIAGDIDAWTDHFTEDMIAMPPNGIPIEGKEAIREWGKPAFEHFDQQHSISPQEIEISGDIAFARVFYKQSLTPKGGGESTQTDGKSIWILKRQTNGSWQATHCIWNSNIPLPE
jgi:uncharacterized protein (TIGR02246 family)